MEPALNWFVVAVDSDMKVNVNMFHQIGLAKC